MTMSVRAQRIQHVSLARPAGSDVEARRFYGEVLGLAEMSVPDALAGLDLIWFHIGDDELHLFVNDQAPTDVGQHLCIQVDDVNVLRARFGASGVEVIDASAIPGRPRFFCRDPFGNMIEFTSLDASQP